MASRFTIGGRDKYLTEYLSPDINPVGELQDTKNSIGISLVYVPGVSSEINVHALPEHAPTTPSYENYHPFEQVGNKNTLTSAQNADIYRDI